MNRADYFAAVKANEEAAALKAAEEKEAETKAAALVDVPVVAKPKRVRNRKKK